MNGCKNFLPPMWNYWLVPLWAVRVAQSYMIHCNTCKSVYIKVLEKWEITTRYRLNSLDTDEHLKKSDTFMWLSPAETDISLETTAKN